MSAGITESRGGPLGDDDNFWSFMGTVAEIAASCLLLLMAEGEGRRTIYSDPDTGDCGFKLKVTDAGKKFVFDNQTDRYCCVVFGRVDDTGNPSFDCQEVPPHEERDYTANLNAYGGGTCCVNAYPASALGNPFPFSALSATLPNLVLTTAGPCHFQLSGVVFTMSRATVTVMNTTTDPLGLILEIGRRNEYNTQVRRQLPAQGEVLIRMDEWLSEDSVDPVECVINLTRFSATRVVERAGARPGKGVPHAAEALGTYRFKIEGLSCPSEMALTASGSDVILTASESGDAAQIWIVTPVVSYEGVTYLGLKINPQSEPTKGLRAAPNSEGGAPGLNLRLAPWDADDPSMVWNIAPSKTDSSLVLIEPYGYTGRYGIAVPGCETGTHASVAAFHDGDHADYPSQRWRLSTT